MCFHFPVMPRIYYALREEKAAPIIDVLADTPTIPAGAQWGTFLRNHDELTLEMVTTEERAAMYGWYAPDPRMRANVGIRRRLAPLLDNSRAEIELINALLLSLPGCPCLYYGDEIGMGDNIWLDDRDAVRTPMQWTPDRNAGFSTRRPGQALPAGRLQSLVYHYNNVNVEAQMAHDARRCCTGCAACSQIRKRHPVFGLGRFESARPRTTRAGVPAGSTATSPATRGRDGALRQQPLAPSPGERHPAARPVQGRRGSTTSSAAAASPPVPTTASSTLTLGSRDFFWLRLIAGRQPWLRPARDAAPPPARSLDLPAWLARQRWYAGKGRVAGAAPARRAAPRRPAGRVGIETLLRAATRRRPSRRSTRCR